MGAGERMALKSIIVKGKEYRANKITEVIMREGKVFIKYLPSVTGNEKRIEAKFKDVKFVDEDGEGVGNAGQNSERNRQDICR